MRGAEGLMYDTHEILKIAADYYKDMFRWESRGSFSLESDFWGSKELVTIEQNADLEAPFSEEVIKATVFSCYPEGALGPDGLSFLYTTNFGNW
jgi:hypothetical protein